MKKYFKVLIVVFILAVAVGCGNDKTRTLTCTSQDEVQKYEVIITEKNDVISSATIQITLSPNEDTFDQFETYAKALVQEQNTNKGQRASYKVVSDTKIEFTSEYDLSDPSILTNREMAKIKDRTLEDNDDFFSAAKDTICKIK